MQTIGHHTCSKENGKEYVLREAPFPAEFSNSRNKIPFLGKGHYYWDDNLEAAIWWGETWYKEKGYFVVENDLKLTSDYFFDLVGNRRHMKLFIELAQRFMPKELKNGTVRIAELIELLKRVSSQQRDIFPYKVLRGIDKKYSENEDAETFFVRYVKDRPKYINLKPRLVICVIEKLPLILQHTRIAHES